VPDDAAGKVGRCPKCQVKIRIPQIEIPAPPPQPEAPSSASQETPPEDLPPIEPDSTPQLSVPDSEPPEGGFDFLPSENEQSASLAHKVKIRQRSSLSAMLVPVAACGIFIGLLVVLLYFFGVFSSKLTGELEALAVPSASLDAGHIGRDVFSVPGETLDLVLTRLEDDPLALVSRLAEFEFRGTPGGLDVSLVRGRAAEIYVVTIAQNRRLKQFADAHREEFATMRTRALASAARTFALEFRKAEEEDRPIDDLASYRDTIGVNALVGGLGFQLVAVFETTVEGTPAFVEQR
jgi:hypothetical protein